MTESKQSPIKLSYVSLGLSEDEITFLQEVAAKGQLTDINHPMVRKIRGINKNILNGANMGMQRIDFGRIVKAVTSDPEYYGELRKSVLETIHSVFYPSENFDPNKILDQKVKEKYQARIVEIKEGVRLAFDGVVLDPMQKETMQNTVQFYREFGIREIPTRNKVNS